MATDLLGPRDVLAGAPSTDAEYRDLLVAAARRRGRRVIVDPRRLSAYVNRGWWVADCPHCNAGISVHPEWAFAGCLSCFRIYAGVDVPEEWRAIEAALRDRPMQHQHWLSAAQRTKFVGRGIPVQAETVEDLERENETHMDENLKAVIAIVRAQEAG